MVGRCNALTAQVEPYSGLTIIVETKTRKRADSLLATNSIHGVKQRGIYFMKANK